MAEEPFTIEEPSRDPGQGTRWWSQNSMAKNRWSSFIRPPLKVQTLEALSTGGMLSKMLFVDHTRRLERNVKTGGIGERLGAAQTNQSCAVLPARDSRSKGREKTGIGGMIGDVAALFFIFADANLLVEIAYMLQDCFPSGLT